MEPTQAVSAYKVTYHGVELAVPAGCVRFLERLNAIVCDRRGNTDQRIDLILRMVEETASETLDVRGAIITLQRLTALAHGARRERVRQAPGVEKLIAVVAGSLAQRAIPPDMTLDALKVLLKLRDERCPAVAGLLSNLATMRFTLHELQTTCRLVKKYSLRHCEFLHALSTQVGQGLLQGPVREIVGLVDSVWGNGHENSGLVPAVRSQFLAAPPQQVSERLTAASKVNCLAVLGRELASTVAARPAEFSFADLARSAGEAARSYTPPPPADHAEVLRERLRMRLEPAEFLEGLRCFAIHGRKNAAAAGVFAAAAVSMIRSFSPSQLVELAGLFAGLGCRDPLLLKTLPSAVMAKIPLFSPSDLAVAAQAFADLRLEDKMLFSFIAQAVTPRIVELNGPGIALLIEAFSGRAAGHQTLLSAAAIQISSRLSECNVEQLAQIAWSWSRSGMKEPDLLQTLLPRILAGAGQMRPRSQVRTLIAYRDSLKGDPRIVETFASAATPAVPQLGHNDCVTLAAAVAISKQHHPALFEKIARRLTSDARNLSPRQLARLLWAFARTNCDDERFFTAAGRAICAKIHRFEPQDLSQTAWALAVLNLQPPGVWPALTMVACRKKGLLKPSDICCIAWGLAVHNEPLAARFMDSVAYRSRLRCQPRYLLQLYQAEVAIGRRAIDDLPPGIAELCVLPPGRRFSSFEQSVGSTLRELRQRHLPEMDFKGPVIYAGVESDFQVTVNGRRWLVECDGVAWHYVGRKAEGRRRGPDLLHDKIFRRAGFKDILHIRGDQWRHLPNKTLWLLEQLSAQPGQGGIMM